MKYTDRQLAETYVSLAEQLDADALTDAAHAFAQHLANAHQLHRFRDIAKEIDVIWKEKYGVANVVIETSQPLSETARNTLIQAVNGATVKEKTNKELIGGARLRIDDRILDGSIKGRLDALKNALSHA